VGVAALIGSIFATSAEPFKDFSQDGLYSDFQSFHNC